MDCEYIKQPMPQTTVVKRYTNDQYLDFLVKFFKKQRYLPFANNKHFHIVITWKSQDENSCTNIIKIKYCCRNIRHIKTSTHINELLM